MDRRQTPRVTLKEPVPCILRIEDDNPLPGYIRNIGTMGVLVEIPDLKERLTMECCQRVVVDEADKDDGYLFSGMVGMTHWIYKDYIGIQFDYPIRASHDELLVWLDDHGLLIEEAS